LLLPELAPLLYTWFCNLNIPYRGCERIRYRVVCDGDRLVVVEAAAVAEMNEVTVLVSYESKLVLVLYAASSIKWKLA